MKPSELHLLLAEDATFSILERIDVGETGTPQAPSVIAQLSVSSNGSTWVKLRQVVNSLPSRSSFSILERIDVGETSDSLMSSCFYYNAFSILERIDVGETPQELKVNNHKEKLSVSSNGSTWVKLGRAVV